MTEDEQAGVQELHRTIHRMTQTNHNLRQGMRKAFKSASPTQEFIEQFFAMQNELEQTKERLLKATRERFAIKLEMAQLEKERDRWKTECDQWREDLKRRNDDRLANR